MLKLMIAEDELIERNYIKMVVEEKYRNEVEVVAHAKDGNEAIIQASKYKPDIILMDIHMPIMDGLEAAKMIKETLPETEILISTAYSLFEYAQNAIEIGVNYYLVKPYSDEKFCEAMDKVLNKLRARQMKTKKEMILHEQVEKLGELMEKEIIMDIVYGGKYNNHKANQFINFFEIKNRTFCCVIIRTDSKSTLEKCVLIDIKRKLKMHFSQVIGYSFLNSIVLFVFDDKLSRSNYSYTIENEIEYELKYKYGIRIQVNVGKIYTDISQIYQSYNELAYENKDDKKEEWLVNEEKHGFDSRKIYKQETSLSNAVVKTNIEEALRILKDINSYILACSSSSKSINIIKEYMKHLYFSIIKSTNDILEKRVKSEELWNTLDSIEKLSSQESILFYMENFVKDLIVEISSIRKNQNNKIIKLAKNYIEENYNKDISLKGVANKLNISFGHLSKCFLKSEGITFSEYLILLRMEKAKQLLRENSKTVYEVAFEVGFTDSNYFSKSFKKYVGVSPKEYSNL